MIRLAITTEARDAIRATLERGTPHCDLQKLQDGRVWIWLPKGAARALADLRRPGETYSDVIIRYVGERSEIERKERRLARRLRGQGQV